MNERIRRAGLNAAVALICVGCEIRPLDPVTGRAVVEDAVQAFDAATFVDEHWKSRILPLIRDESVDLDTLLAELALHPDAASAFGHRVGDGPLHVRVRGTGRVVRVDTTSRAGVLVLALAGGREATLQIGPVIRGTALRDALPFVSFDRFVNQLEYAGVSNALNARLVESVLAPLDRAALTGVEIRFAGVFEWGNLDTVIITPVEIEVAN
jgi:predicted lipoprotein